MRMFSRSQTPVWGTPITKLRLVCSKQNSFITIKHQAELEARRSQARAWERDTRY